LNNIAFNDYGFDDVINVFKRENKKCWEKMAQMRNSSLCSICSAKASRFYILKRVVVSDAHCAVLINDCWISFKLLNFYLRRLTTVQKMSYKISKFSESLVSIINRKFMKSKKINSLYESVKGTVFDKFQPVLNLYDLNDPNSVLNKNNVNPLVSRCLCRRYIRLVGDTILTPLDRVVSSSKSATFSLGSLSQKLVDKHKAA
jgi:hypothetical protein